MRAVVRRGTTLSVDTVADPVPGAGEVLSRTLACGICGSDLHILHHADHVIALANSAGGHTWMDPSADVVFGHEFCTEIVDVGPGTEQRFKVGTQVCAVPFVLGPGGPEIVGYSNRYPGGFGEQMVLAQDLCFEVPNGLPAEQAALTEPFAVGEHAVARSCLGPDTIPMVIGCGPVGISVIAALKHRGIGPIIATDYSAIRRKMAEQYGADEVIDPAQHSPHAGWADLGVPATANDLILATLTGNTPKRAIIFECVGVPGLLNQIITDAPPGTEVVVVGVCTQTDTLEPFIASDKEIDLKFVFGYTPEEYGETLHRLGEGIIDGRPIITGTVGLEGVADAFETLYGAEDHVKIIVKPTQ